MSKFLQDEKPFQTDFKAKASYFSDPARAQGIYKDHVYPFALPREYADQNLIAALPPPMCGASSKNHRTAS